MNIKVSNITFSKNQYLKEKLLNEFPKSEFNEDGRRFNENQLVEFLCDAEAAIIGLELITSSLLKKLPKLKMIAKFGVGLDNIDVDACEKYNVKVGWTGGVNKRAVAEMTLGFMLMHSRNLFKTSNLLKQYIWEKNGGYSLSGKTIGIIGFGYIGQEVYNLLAPFNCNILVNDISTIKYQNEIKYVSKEELYKKADLITIHTPLTDLTKNLINHETLRKMKSSVFLINTARGGIINESDLEFALKNNIIGGAALDVYDSESVLNKNLIDSPNLICTPHIGGNSSEAVRDMGMSAINHLKKYKKSIK